MEPEDLLEEGDSRRPRRQREERSQTRSAWDRVRTDSSDKSKDKDRFKQKPTEKPVGAAPRKAKAKAVKDVKVSKDVFIPSMVSVGTLAKLLQVKQGMSLSRFLKIQIAEVFQFLAFSFF